MNNLEGKGICASTEICGKGIFDFEGQFSPTKASKHPFTGLGCGR